MGHERRTAERMWSDAGPTSESHWAQPHVLGDDERYLTWFLTFEGHDGLAARLVEIVDAVGADFMDWLAPDELHLTLQGLGPVDRLAPATVEQVVDRTREMLASVQAFRMRLGLLTLGTQGVLLLPMDFTPLHGLRATLWHAAAGVLGEESTPGGPELDVPPHVSLSYCNAVADLGPVRDRVASLREPMAREPALVTVDHVDLVELRRTSDGDRRCYRFEARAGVRLGGDDGGRSS